MYVHTFFFLENKNKNKGGDQTFEDFGQAVSKVREKQTQAHTMSLL